MESIVHLTLLYFQLCHQQAHFILRYYDEGHPNTRLFISHCGMLGTQEAAFHGIPMLGLPFGFDQVANIKHVVSGGRGLKLDWDKLDNVTLYRTISLLLEDPRYNRKTKRYSQIIKLIYAFILGLRKMQEKHRS